MIKNNIFTLCNTYVLYNSLLPSIYVLRCQLNICILNNNLVKMIRFKEKSTYLLSQMYLCKLLYKTFVKVDEAKVVCQNVTYYYGDMWALSGTMIFLINREKVSSCRPGSPEACF